MEGNDAVKSLRILLGLAVLVVTLYFWGKLTGRIYFDPLCKRFGEPLGLEYTGYSIHYRRSPAECWYLDANGQIEHVSLREIPKQFLDYVRGVLQYVLFMAGAIGAVALTKAIGGDKD